ncbi:MAG: 2-oxoacid:acceptor oxidoreductase family protein [Deltaproteobacteria bacterium]|nr:2-oxoacid:acceptor oxidoreductase family protein [Deltaproteobacteria bacterium]
MGALKQVRLSGFGGQGVVLAGTILGHGAVKDGKWVAGSSSYGAQARGGSARADVVVSDRPIVFPHVIEANVLAAMAQTAYDKYTEQLARGATVIYDDELVRPRSIDGAIQIGVPATSTAIKLLNQQQSANIVILGAIAVITGIVSKGALSSAIEENVSERFKDLNIRALELGYKLGEADKQ